MPGLLAKVLTNGTVQNVAEVPIGVSSALLEIRVMNPTAAQAEVKLYLTTQTSPAVVDLLEPRAVLSANGGSLIHNCVHCSPSEKLFIEGPAGLVVRTTIVEQD